MTQLKDTAAFEDLQVIVGNEIAGVFLARLNEFGVPEDQLQTLADEICYDIASAMHAIGDYEIPHVASPPAPQGTNTDEVASPEPVAGNMDFLEEKTDEVEPVTVATDNMEFLEEKTDEVEPLELNESPMEFMEEKTDEVDFPGPDVGGMEFMEEKTDETDFLELDADDAVLVERTNDLGLKDDDSDTRPRHHADRVLSQEYIVKLLNEAKSAMA